MDALRDKELRGDGKHYTMDVVCGMDIIAEKMKHITEYHDTTYYFCSRTCQKHFEDFPERYVWEDQ